MKTRIKKFIRQNIKHFKKWMRGKSPSFIHIFKQRVYLDNAKHPIDKLKLLYKSIYDAYFVRKTILFYPHGPLEFHALYKALNFLGYRVTTSPKNRFNIAIKWWRAFDGNPYSPNTDDYTNAFKNLNPKKMLNSQCNDISKQLINSIFDDVFPYSISIDPYSYKGKCVMKSNWNALHEGGIIDCPVQEKQDNVVYQKLICNELDNGYVEDMRVPIFKDVIPFVYMKYRSIDDRFVDREHTAKKAIIANPLDVLTETELNMINVFCGRLGLDYGELDVLRHKDDGNIYIVDANNTPSGPPCPISIDDDRKAIKKIAQAFEDAFDC